jgi:ABC-type lipoprotein release transport system permease subunit
MEAAILLTGTDKLPEALAELSHNMPGYKVEPWQVISPQTAFMITAIDSATLIIMVVIMLALAFGIINTMLMAVLERIREIGMLIAIGMNRVRVFFMVVLETMLLTLTGCPAGFLLGWLTITWLGHTGIDMSSFADNALKNYGYGTVVYPELPSGQIFQILLIVWITALLASIFPAWKTLRLRPAEAIRQ